MEQSKIIDTLETYQSWGHSACCRKHEAQEGCRTQAMEENVPYANIRRTTVDYKFHTKEQQDFYEIVLLDKKSIVSDMRWVD